MTYRVGVDIGGTFTDFCVFDEATDQLRTLKVLSTPDRPGAEVMAGLRELEARFGITAREITRFTHGTTVGINTVIQRRGVNLCLFTTANFEDVLEVARLKMPDPYDIFSRRPPPLVPRERVFGIRGRILHDGSEAEPVDEEGVTRAVQGVRAVGGEAVVIALLHAYRNPAHEREVRAIVQRLAPELDVTCASDVWPIIREYERTTTAVVAGYVQPRVSRYLSSLQAALKQVGVAAEPMITKSNGGIMTAELGKTRCVQTLLSGTAAGVIGASHVARQTGARDTLSLDVGGTSADVALIADGQPQYGVGEMVGEFPIYIPTVAVTSVGNGGGSIARVDRLGVLKVGPESAGSSPGPACYGRGGDRATITDAFAVCGLLGQTELGYRAVTLDLDRARAAVGEVGGRLGLGIEAAAEAIIRVAVSGMYREVSKLLSRRGIDPRGLSLHAFGGAGPMIGGFLARELGMPRVVVPVTPGVLSAFGGLIADVKNDFIRTVYLDLDAGALPTLREGFADLAGHALRWLRGEQGYGGEATLLYSADMRYRGQSHEIETPLEAAWLDPDAPDGLARLLASFHATHERVYDHADPEAPVQAINLRLVVVGTSPKPRFAPLPEGDAPPTPVATIEVYVDGARVPAPLYERASLLAGQRFEGPAVIAQDDCTTCLPPGYAGRVDRFGNLLLDRTA